VHKVVRPDESEDTGATYDPGEEGEAMKAQWANVIGARMSAAGDTLYKEPPAEGSAEAKEFATGTRAHCWDSGATSSQSFARSESQTQGVSWKTENVDKMGNTQAYFIGLSQEGARAADVDPMSIDFAFSLDDKSALFVVEKGNYRNNFGSYETGDELAVKVKGDTVTYHHNGDMIYISKQKPTFPLVVDSSFHGAGAKASGVELSVKSLA
jgi:hypothetical protein